EETRNKSSQRRQHHSQSHGNLLFSITFVALRVSWSMNRSIVALAGLTPRKKRPGPLRGGLSHPHFGAASVMASTTAASIELMARCIPPTIMPPVLHNPDL